jgi:hypothetical protein
MRELKDITHIYFRSQSDGLTTGNLFQPVCKSSGDASVSIFLLLLPKKPMFHVFSGAQRPIFPRVAMSAARALLGESASRGD